MKAAAPSALEGEALERFRRGMSPTASLEDQVFYLTCRFEGHMEVINTQQREYTDLLDRNNELERENKHYEQVLSNRSGLERRFGGAIRSAIDAHGPITRDGISSATKRVVSEMYAAFRHKQVRTTEENIE